MVDYVIGSEDFFRDLGFPTLLKNWLMSKTSKIITLRKIRLEKLSMDFLFSIMRILNCQEATIK